MYPCPECDYRGGHLQCGPPENGTTVCPECGARYDITWLPLFVITGGGGCGKTTVGETLVGRLNRCLVLEMDHFAWFRKAGTKQDFWEYLLYLSMSLSRNGRPVVLCGWVNPSQIESCPTAAYFFAIHTLVLACDKATQTARLEGRYPKRRRNPVTAEYIEESLRGTRLLKEEAESRPKCDRPGYH